MVAWLPGPRTPKLQVTVPAVCLQSVEVVMKSISGERIIFAMIFVAGSGPWLVMRIL